MRFATMFFCWCALLVLAWPVALLALVVLPLAWLVCLPFRIAGVVVGALLALLGSLFMLPARALGYGR